MYYSRDVGEKFMRRLQKQERCLYTASHCYPNWEIWDKEYALNPCCPACARDLVDCLSEKMFAGSKCKAEMEVEADE